MALTHAEFKNYLSRIDQLPQDEKVTILDLLRKMDEADIRVGAQQNFLDFVKAQWPDFIEGYHHRVMADAFERVANGKLKRLIINMAPRHTKSEFASHMLPAWFLGKFPNKYIIQASNTADLAVDFGRKVRNTISSPSYQKIFPGVSIQADAAAAGKWKTSKGGEYFAIGTGGTVTGRGGDLIILDDPHSEQEAKQAEFRPEIYDTVFDWYTSGPRQRLQPGGAMIIVMTRWAKRDLTGQILRAAAERGELVDQWEVIELPAILPSGKPIWPEYWPLEQLEALRDELPLPKWQAQYQQQPTSDEGALVKREWWRLWEGKKPPECEFVIQSWDTAFLKNERADFSACTTWGVFYTDDTKDGRTRANVILLDAFKKRMEFPELKAVAYEHYKEWEPDAFIVEAKAAGSPLIFELRAMDIPVQDFTPTRGNDKIARVNAVSDLFASGSVWAPSTRWAEEVIEEFAEFPAGEHDDLVDSSTQALLRFRKGGFIQTTSDYEDMELPVLKRHAEYY
jgi:predicted phage terminase large subunit-like protein